MLIFIKPSFVSVIPCSPILFGPLLALHPPLLFSPCPLAFAGGCPHDFPSLKTGLCGSTGLPCTLIPGETALLLNDAGSKSSSLRLFLLIFRATSAAVGGAVDDAKGVEDRDLIRSTVFATGFSTLVRSEEGGVSMLSSLMPEELSLGYSEGGGVLYRSSNVFQKFMPPDFLFA